LIEVLAGLAIMGTLAVSLVLARGALMEQYVLAQRKLRATEAADALLAHWWQNPAAVPRAAMGEVPGYEELRWRTSIAPNEDVQMMGGQVVRVEMFDASDEITPVLIVELVLPGTEAPDM